MKRSVIIPALIVCVAGAAGASDSPEGSARINQIQVLGSHNSYKLAIDPSLLQILRESEGNRMQSLEYSHRPMEDQLDLGLRSLEIDVLHDPEGGRYARPRGIDMVREKGLKAGPPYDPE